MIINNGASLIHNLVTQGNSYLVVAPPHWQERIVTVLQYHGGQDLGGKMDIGFAAVYLGFHSNDLYVGGTVGWPSKLFDLQALDPVGI